MNIGIQNTTKSNPFLPFGRNITAISAASQSPERDCDEQAGKPSQSSAERLRRGGKLSPFEIFSEKKPPQLSYIGGDWTVFGLKIF
ncbi:hypothetical protein KAU19_05335 [Candidatus Parcubacteria bacterium]|nr:hypothetical protein [Candidatus Parcubacteria bacterium]